MPRQRLTVAASAGIWFLPGASAVLVHRHESAAARDECACLIWQDAYKDHGVSCMGGQGVEFYSATKRGFALEAEQEHLGAEWCTGFFDRLPGNTCVNVDFTVNSSWSGGQWCYVSSTCTALNGGKAINQNTSWKVCTEGQDDLLRSKTPQQLVEFQHANNLDLGLTARMAYPVNQNTSWNSAQVYWKTPKGEWPSIWSKSPGYTRLAAKLDKIVEEGKPMLIDSHDAHPPYGVVVGRRAYEIHFSPKADEAAFKAGDLRTINEIVCVANC